LAVRLGGVGPLLGGVDCTCGVLRWGAGCVLSERQVPGIAEPVPGAGRHRALVSGADMVGMVGKPASPAPETKDRVWSLVSSSSSPIFPDTGMVILMVIWACLPVRNTRRESGWAQAASATV